MAGHIDQLAEWYESAERITKTNLPGDGDFIIYPHRGGIGYIIERSEGGWTSEIVLPDEDCRILSRAPKPAWHDAAAVIAHTARFSERRPFALTHTEDVLDPYNAEWITRDDLIDPAPLIEAKVTDEMVNRARVHASAYPINGDNLMRAFLAAALGLETE